MTHLAEDGVLRGARAERGVEREGRAVRDDALVVGLRAHGALRVGERLGVECERVRLAREARLLAARPLLSRGYESQSVCDTSLRTFSPLDMGRTRQSTRMLPCIAAWHIFDAGCPH